MVSRHYRDALQQALGPADHDAIGDVSNNWFTHSLLLDQVSSAIRQSGRKVDSEIEGEAGLAMVAKFTAISDRLDEDSAKMKKGSEALGIAQAAAVEAVKARNGIMLSGPMNQEPTRPEQPSPGTQPTTEQSTKMAQYNAQMNTYLANEQAYEDQARAALEHMDTQYAVAAATMMDIHGEPDPSGPADSPSSPGGSTPPSAPVVPPGTPTTPITPPPPRDDDDKNPTVKPPPTIEQPTPIEKPPPVVQPPTEVVHPPTEVVHPPTVHPPYNPTPVPEYQPGHYATNVSGGTDSGVDYSPSTFPGQGPSVGTGSAGGAGIGGPGMAAGGLAAGSAAGAAGMRGAPASPLRTSGVKGIGATTRPSGPGSLSRGTTPGSAGARSTGAPRGSSIGGSRGAAGAKGATAGSRTAAGAGSRSASSSSSSAKAGTKGATSRGRTSGSTTGKGATKGKGLFRRGSNGSAAGTRGGRKKDDERTEQRDALVYEQDWLGDESAGTGVLD